MHRCAGRCVQVNVRKTMMLLNGEWKLEVCWRSPKPPFKRTRKTATRVPTTRQEKGEGIILGCFFLAWVFSPKSHMCTKTQSAQMRGLSPLSSGNSPNQPHRVEAWNKTTIPAPASGPFNMEWLEDRGSLVTFLPVRCVHCAIELRVFTKIWHWNFAGDSFCGIKNS